MEMTKSRSAPIAAEEKIRQRLSLLMRNEDASIGGERRINIRRAYPYPVYLTPVDPSGQIQVDETVIALGKHISEIGLDFYHREALPHRRMIASLECGDGNWLAFEMDLSWCRFGRHGYYENGGRFIRIADCPLGTSKDQAMSA